jgi:hypothetical protein
MVKAKPISSREKKTLLFNPGKFARKTGSSNPGQLIAMGWLNPEDKHVKKKKQHKAPKQKHRDTKGQFFGSQHKARNPSTAVMVLPPALARALETHKPKKPKKHKKHHNPDAKRILERPLNLLKDGVAAGGGFVATKQIPQVALKSRNVGWVGYLANTIAAFLAAAGIGAAFGPRAGGAALVGGGLAIVARAAEEFTPLGQHLMLSGVGDPVAAGKLGAIVPGYFVYPEQRDRTTGRPVIPRAIVEAVLAQLPPPAAAPATLKGFHGSLYR